MLLCFFSPPSVIPLSPNPGHLCSTSCSKGERHVPPEELRGRTRVLLTHKVANMRKDAFFIKGWMLPHARACVQPEGYKTNPTSVPQQQSSSAEVLVLEGWGLKAVSSVSPLQPWSWAAPQSSCTALQQHGCSAHCCTATQNVLPSVLTSSTAASW